MSDICFQPAWRQMDALNLGSLTSAELLEVHIAQFNRVNKALNAVIKTDLERARERARALDRMRADGKILGPLHGLPMTVKDTFDVDSMPATAGAPEYAKRAKPVEDASVVARAKAAGAIIWGKTNVPYMAGEWQSHNRLFGKTSNPYDMSRTPGGSSGGASAALAAGITPLEVGSDIGGSLRIPAHFTGIVSLKPTYGVMPQAGHVPPAPDFPGEVDLNVVGPMARTVRDLKLLRSVMQRGASGSQTGFSLSIEDKKLAVWTEHDTWPVAKEVQDLISVAVAEFEGAGAEVARVKPDIDPDELLDVYLSLLIPIVALDMPQLRTIGLKFLRPILKYLQRYEKSPFTDGNWAVKADLSHLDWLKMDARRSAMKWIMRDFFKTYDALILPVSPTPAIEHNIKGTVLERTMKIDGTSAPYASHLQWISLASALHLPAVTIPIGRTDDGLPVGIQIVGRQGEDARLLDIAEAMEGLLGGYRRPRSDLGLL
ncbi:amidase family protein [Ponticaulis sp.]|uniref:amidase family protein n=1 Tax=Ponticaulis sp. TaxID=2020902 RepID=UPI0025DF454A|nr:amidase family protein [Ponticaulis sp.]